MGGTPFPLRENRVVNIGGAALSSVDAKRERRRRRLAGGAFGRNRRSAAKPRLRRGNNGPDAPTQRDVDAWPKSRAHYSAFGSRRAAARPRLEIVAQTLARATALEAKYFAKDARAATCASASKKAPLKILWRGFTKLIWRRFSAPICWRAIWDEVAVLARHGRLDEAVFELFHPLKFMLATPADG